jgi:hypothetical protein
MIHSYKISVATAGAAGSAVGSGTSTRPVNGRLLAVYIDYTSQPATTDVTITSTLPTQTLLTVTDANTDAWFYPRVLLDSTVGADLTAIYDAFPVDGYVSVAVAGGDAGSVDVTLLVEC